MLNFYDFEVVPYDWLVVIINPINKTREVVVNDKEKLHRIYEQRKGEIWIGYNNRRYDQYVYKSILCGFNPKGINDWIIKENKHGFQYSTLLNEFPFINFDTMLRTDTGLKSLEGFMGNNIKESSVPFDIDRKLTQEEIDEMVEYCTHDVEQTIEVFLNRKEEFDAKMGLVKIFQRPLTDMGKTNAQLVAAICGGKGLRFRNEKGESDEFEFPFAPPMVLTKYRHIRDWYRRPENFDYKKFQKETVAGVPHIFAWGGIHGAVKKYYGKGIYIMADVTAYYPSMQIEYKWGYRNMANPENFEKIHSENLRLKEVGDKVARLPYKIADNSISGQLKDKHSSLYDPRENNAICVNGQLLLLDLIEKLEPHCQLIQSNTDGILIKMPDRYEGKDADINTWFNAIDDIVWEWEKRTGMRMGFDIYTKVFQKDVNNYLLVAPDGKAKTKGAYTKSLSKLDYDLPIINKAMREYMVHGTPVEKTIAECNELIMFQKIVKLTGKYDFVEHNGIRYDFKCYRVFASNKRKDGQILKCKYVNDGTKKDKFANTPDHCFINNDDVNGLSVDSNLDKNWYVNLTKERLRQYGVDC